MVVCEGGGSASCRQQYQDYDSRTCISSSKFFLELKLLHLTYRIGHLPVDVQQQVTQTQQIRNCSPDFQPSRTCASSVLFLSPRSAMCLGQWDSFLTPLFFLNPTYTLGANPVGFTREIFLNLILLNIFMATAFDQCHHHLYPRPCHCLASLHPLIMVLQAVSRPEARVTL